MRSPRQLWKAFNLGKQLRSRPSEIYFIEDELTAFCFDNAVQLFGVTLENKLSEIENRVMEGKGKNQGKTAQRKKTAELHKWLSSDNPDAPRRGQFRSPQI